jgi:hypothetical protein
MKISSREGTITMTINTLKRIEKGRERRQGSRGNPRKKWRIIGSHNR